MESVAAFACAVPFTARPVSQPVAAVCSSSNSVKRSVRKGRLIPGAAFFASDVPSVSFSAGQFFGATSALAARCSDDSSSAKQLVPIVTASASGSAASKDAVIDQFTSNVMTTYARYPLVMVKGQDSRLWDIEGKEYLDFVAGIATCSLGHAHPNLVKAVAEQIATVNHVSNLYYTPSQSNLAKRIVDCSIADRVFFCNSGAEANEAAIKLARKYAHTKLGIAEPVIITAHASFHGRTLATITATGQPKYQQDFEPLMPGFEYVEYNNVDDLEKAVKRINANGPRLAGILMEALQGEGGVRPGDRAFFARVREICNETGALMMMDEVQVGVGRTGKMWGYENLGIAGGPDVFSTAKGLGGGVPIGAMGCKAFCDVLTPGTHASTFGGNPLACSAALAVFDTIEKEGLLANVAARGEQLKRACQALQAKYPKLVTDYRGWGLIAGLQLSEAVAIQASDVISLATQQGLLLVPAGPKVVRAVPPLVVTEAQMDAAMAKLDTVFGELSKQYA
eukprot:tig00021590_g22775.t1